MTSIAILQSNYIPWRGYFDLIKQSDHFVFYDEVQYTKNDWRNRNQIIGKSGPQWLTIAIKTAGKLTQSIAQTEVADARWAKKHFNAIQTSYAKSPYYSDCKDILSDLYQICMSEDKLSHINQKFITEICNYLGIETRIHHSTDILGGEGQTGRLIEICKSLGATKYLSGKAAQNYLDVELMEKANIEVVWMEYPQYKRYAQNDGDYRQTVSIIDALCNLPRDQILRPKNS